MSTMKPDYFIAYNGMPSILLARNRHMITQTTTALCDRVSSNKHQHIHPPRSKRMVDDGANQQAHIEPDESDKNLRNRAIKESLRHSKSTKDLINAQIVRSGGWNHRHKDTEVLSGRNDNGKCNRNAKRSTRAIEMEHRDNKLMHQRKYDNTIFRHDLPDRIILPPLPI